MTPRAKIEKKTLTTSAAAVLLESDHSASSSDLVVASLPEPPRTADDLGPILSWVRACGGSLPLPGAGRTAERWERLATVAATDLSLARALEPHVDALAILAESGSDEHRAADSVWGVYAAEGGPEPVRARRSGSTGHDWLLTGTKPWCSLASVADQALITAWTPDGERGLFAISLSHPGVVVPEQPWSARGLRAITSGPIVLTDVPGTSVGGPGWYLDRPGFAWGGMGVAAIWYGGGVALARRLAHQCRHRDPDQVALMHLGEVDARLTAARSLLADAARRVDSGTVSGETGALLAARVRHVVAGACEEVLARCGHALGPGPLTQEEDHARRVADLVVYLRQHHAERDAAALGRLSLSSATW